MDRRLIKLDNPVFAGNLRYEHRRSAYVRRSLQPATFSDIVRVQTPKPKPKHSGVPAGKVHANRSNAAHIIAPRPVRAVNTTKPIRRKQRSTYYSSHHKTTKQHALLYTMAIMVFAVGIAVSLNGFRTNREVAAQVKQQQQTDSASGTDSSQASAAPGATAPSTVKPAAASVASYIVAPSLPKYIDITKLGVHSRILSMGVNSKNSLQTPGNIYDTGWYNASAQPGQPGAMLIDGHISSWKSQGVFYGLKKLTNGDKITVTRGDNKTFTFTVVKTQLFDAKNVDMASMVVSQDPSKPGLNLISCSGDVIPGTNEFNKRIVVYAVME